MANQKSRRILLIIIVSFLFLVGVVLAWYFLSPRDLNGNLFWGSAKEEKICCSECVKSGEYLPQKNCGAILKDRNGSENCQKLLKERYTYGQCKAFR